MSNSRARFIVFAVLILGLFLTLVIQLAKLTVVEGEMYEAMATELDEREITVSGARGSILDRNGLPLAYDEKSYNVQFYRDPMKSSETAYYTAIIIDTINIIEENGGQTVDTFAIRYDEGTDEYSFYWGDIDPKFMPRREENWRENMYVSIKKTEEGEYKLSPEDIYLYLRRKYEIPSEMGYEEARKILSIWQEVQLASWVAYKPVVIAYNVNLGTVAEIETHGVELEGMSIADSTVRIYPRNTMGAHTIGYMGKIVEEEKLDEMTDLGYKVDDLIGVTGIEASMESFLSGNSAKRQGRKIVEIDNMAVVQNVLSSTEPSQGDNVVLTLDTPLQLALEKSLAENIPRIHQDQVDRFNEYRDTIYKKIESIEEVALAETGAAVVMDVHTGEVLAMGSYPSYDLNIFTGGIEHELFKEMINDPTKPLFNNAVSSRGTPGSIFKMVTGLGGLMEGVITLEKRIDCKGDYTAYTRHGESPGCWTKYPSNHSNQTIVEGLQNSCNYFFFTISDEMHIGRLNDWADKFGLTSLTGIELPEEVTGYVGNQDILYNNELSLKQQKSSIPYLVKKRFLETIDIIEEERNVTYSEEVRDKTADELLYLSGVEWVEDANGNLSYDGNTMGDYVRSILFENLKVPESVSRSSAWFTDITSYIDELRWTPFLSLTTGIGQGVTRVTPIAVARYVAALVNGGTVYEAHVVDKVMRQDGTVLFDQEPVVFDTLGAPEEYLEAIKKGMSKVVSEDGTAGKYFENYEYKEMVGGKTGTAEVSLIDLENNSWFVCFAPYDEPEIAVVVYIPHGYSGGLSSLVAQDIITYYIEDSQLVAKQNIPVINSLVPENNLLVPKDPEEEDGESIDEE